MTYFILSFLDIAEVFRFPPAADEADIGGRAGTFVGRAAGTGSVEAAEAADAIAGAATVCF